MSKGTKIEWTDSTWNPLVAYRGDKRGWHCEKISPECDHCYAASMNKRSDGLIGIGTGLNYAPDSRAKLRFGVHGETLLQPLKWKKPRRIFVCSMTDLFGDWHTDEMIDRVFAVMALCQQHTFQVVTKRPERALAWFLRPLPLSDRRTPPAWPLPNVWLGVTAGDQKRADERIPLLLQTPAAVRFISAEPLLGPLDLTGYLPYLDWVIAGGESGPGARRPSHPDWFRSLRDQCQPAEVPFFFKQWGEYLPYEEFDAGLLRPASERPDQPLAISVVEGYDAVGSAWNWPKGSDVAWKRVGKKATGRLLDGVEWGQFPAQIARGK